MSPVVAEEPPLSQDAATAARRPALTALDTCPFLRSGNGAWSSTHAARELRCWAVSPPSQPALHKQRELCVSALHAGCATFEAATAPDAALRSPDPGDLPLWPAPSPLPIALEAVHGRAVAGVPPRTGGQALLAGLMVVAFLVLVLAKTTQLGVSDATGSPPVPSPASASVALIEPVASTAPAPSPSPATPSPVASPSKAPASPGPSAPASQRTYTVKSGDTLSKIAGKFQTTVKAIAAANQIVDPRTIHPGQVLVIP